VRDQPFRQQIQLKSVAAPDIEHPHVGAQRQRCDQRFQLGTEGPVEGRQFVGIGGSSAGSARDAACSDRDAMSGDIINVSNA
jgi:hypothetical protein